MRRARLVEGDGWVNWSGLATLQSDLGNRLRFALERLLGTCPTGWSRTGRDTRSKRSTLSRVTQV
jgi:hypothetical protein